MLTSKTLQYTLLYALSILPPIQACVTKPNLPENNGTFPSLISGTDEPADLATTGYVQNHFALNIVNLTQSIDFYTRVFGFRLLFTFLATERFSISYLGHSHGGKNGTAYQTAAELNRNKNNMEGLLELSTYTTNTVETLPAATKSQNTFSHLGIVVPDIHATQKRIEELGVKIIKRTGELPAEDAMEALANAYGFNGILQTNRTEADIILGVLAEAVPGGIDFLIVLDPDGNMIEIQPQELPQLPV